MDLMSRSSRPRERKTTKKTQFQSHRNQNKRWKEKKGKYKDKKDKENKDLVATLEQGLGVIREFRTACVSDSNGPS